MLEPLGMRTQGIQHIEEVDTEHEIFDYNPYQQRLKYDIDITFEVESGDDFAQQYV